MGTFANQLTAPLGVRLFPGGPYPDAGFGDQQTAAAQQYIQQLAPLIAQIAQSAGVTNPMTGEQGQYADNLYQLSPVQQGEVNQQASVDRQAYDQIMSRVEANLSARGMKDMLPAAQAYLTQQLQSQLGSERIQAGQNAYNTRMSAIQSIAQLLGQGQQQKMGALETNRQSALAASQQSAQALGNALALGMYAGGVGPFGAAKPANGTAPASTSPYQPLTSFTETQAFAPGAMVPNGQYAWPSIYE